MHVPTSTRAAVLALALAAAPAAAQQTVTLEPAHLQSLETRLNAWAAALPGAERALWDDVLRRAASAPVATGEIRVAPVLQIGPGGGCESPGAREDARRVGIIVQGGREAAERAGIIIQGGLVARPGAGIAEGVRRSDRATAGGRPGVAAARVPRPQNSCIVAIGPKQDDPAAPPQSLGRRLAGLASDLPEEERGALNWLLTRAIAVPGTANPNDPRPTPAASVRRALGLDPLAIGPKQDDPAPPPPSRWVLRY